MLQPEPHQGPHWLFVWYLPPKIEQGELFLQTLTDFTWTNSANFAFAFSLGIISDNYHANCHRTQGTTRVSPKRASSGALTQGFCFQMPSACFVQWFTLCFQPFWLADLHVFVSPLLDEFLATLGSHFKAFLPTVHFLDKCFQRAWFSPSGFYACSPLLGQVFERAWVSPLGHYWTCC
jgi:hypothetical protein